MTKYPVDLTGRSSTNLVTGEEQLLLRYQGVPYCVVVMDNGGFYTQGLIVTDSNFQELTPNVDYIATYGYADASARVGEEILGAIVILNQSLTGSVHITAQMVGGDYAFSLTELADTLAYLKTLNGKVPEWGGYIGVRPQWVDGELNQARWTRMGFEPFNLELERIAVALTTGDQGALQAYRDNVKALHNAFVARFDDRLKRHIDDKNNPHKINAAHVQLGNVSNFPVASDAVALAGTSNDTYVTAAQTKNVIRVQALQPLNAHKAREDNPHGLTPGQAGTHSQAEINGMIANKLPLNGRADNANLLQNRSGGWSSPQELVNDMRANLDVSNFGNGVFSPWVLGGGTPSWETVLLGNGQWTTLRSIFNEFDVNDPPTVYWIGDQSNAQQALANISVVYANVVAYPVGSIVMFRCNEEYLTGTGNGGGYYNVTLVRAAYRTGSGWVQI
jgi:hypothetical protein